MTTVRCSRCQREGEIIPDAVQGPGGLWAMFPEGWTGSISREGIANDAICSGCQLAEWHPHCTSLRTGECGDGERVDIEALKRGKSFVVQSEAHMIEADTDEAETDEGVRVGVVIDSVPVVVRSLDDLGQIGVNQCGYVDLTVSWTDEDYPNGTDDIPEGWWRCPQCGGTDFDGVHADESTPPWMG